jgi:hypothetical protein
LSIFSERIFDSRVVRGIPSLAAAPDAPNTRPPLSLKAASAFLAKRSMKYSTRMGMSSVRSRKGGISIGKYIEPVKQVAPERARSDGSLQVAVRGSNQPNISFDRSGSADSLEFVFLQNTQESYLGLGWKLSDLIEEDRASSGQLKTP